MSKLEDSFSIQNGLAENINWKNLYLKEAANYLDLQQKYRSMNQDIKYHIEYNQFLENKITTLENEYFNLLESHHKKIIEDRFENLKASLNYVDLLKKTMPDINIDNLKDKIVINNLNNEIFCEQKISVELRNHLNSIRKDKEDLQRELMLSKSQFLEFSEKLDEEIETNQNLKKKTINKLAL